MDWSLPTILGIAVIGLLGGTLGGLLGLGGSVFIIPALTFALGSNYHLYQASALVANVFVAVAATRKHRGRGTIRKDVVPLMASLASGAALVGVFTSNRLPTAGLAIAFGCFLCYASVSELISLARRRPDAQDGPPDRASIPAVCAAGTIGGFASGLLGIGGGAIMVPILRKYARLPIRQAVACSAAAMIIACLIGAFAKNATLSAVPEARELGVTAVSSLSLAAVLAPCAMMGGAIGAGLVYRLPIGSIRLVLAIFLSVAGYRMIASGMRVSGSGVSGSGVSGSGVSGSPSPATDDKTAPAQSAISADGAGA